MSASKNTDDPPSEEHGEIFLPLNKISWTSVFSSLGETILTSSVFLQKSFSSTSDDSWLSWTLPLLAHVFLGDYHSARVWPGYNFMCLIGSILVYLYQAVCLFHDGWDCWITFTELQNHRITESQNHRITESQSHRITESQNGRGWTGPLWVI